MKKGDLFIPFERAMGSRQDLKFDGCVPLFWNRKIVLEFIRGYIDCPKSQNVLDKSLYTLLKCNECVALLRANTLWKHMFSEPFRCLAGKTGKLKALRIAMRVGDMTLAQCAVRHGAPPCSQAHGALTAQPSGAGAVHEPRATSRGRPIKTMVAVRVYQ